MSAAQHAVFWDADARHPAGHQRLGARLDVELDRLRVRQPDVIAEVVIACHMALA